MVKPCSFHAPAAKAYRHTTIFNAFLVGMGQGLFFFAGIHTGAGNWGLAAALGVVGVGLSGVGLHRRHVADTAHHRHLVDTILCIRCDPEELFIPSLAHHVIHVYREGISNSPE